ncbi:MAG: HAD family hydrolase [Candidatus Bathyarchaeota archaeon]|nr:MAG: HAD family hydrolase [Candidatus Bathyarchaeota archaeon]
MRRIKAVIFDFIGTITDLAEYSLQRSEDKLYKSLVKSGYNASSSDFFKAYKRAHDKFREIRYSQLTEITNAVWISEALNHLGYAATPEEEKVRIAVNAFFEDYVHALRIRSSAMLTLKKLHSKYKLGIVSNFTYAPVIYRALRNLEINRFFNAVVVSDEVGWRKPSGNIFQKALNRLNVKAEEAFYVGDTPQEDILGANKVGMTTVFIPSQFNSLEDLRKSGQQPDHVIEKLSCLTDILTEQPDVRTPEP